MFAMIFLQSLGILVMQYYCGHCELIESLTNSDLGRLASSMETHRRKARLGRAHGKPGVSPRKVLGISSS